MQPANCAMISGFSGLPKLRLLVTARGVAPVAQILRQLSATACLPPSAGSARQYLGLQSDVIAKALADGRRVSVDGFLFSSTVYCLPSTFTMAASAALPVWLSASPGPAQVCPRTRESYCSH